MTAARTSSRIAFLDYLRAAAVVLVVWDHLVGQWLDQDHRSWLPLTYVRRYISGPLNITQDFGWLGVVLFFLVSGFVISHVSSTESEGQFALRRIFRIYVPLVVAVLVVVVTTVLRRHYQLADPPALGYIQPVPSWSQAGWAMTLLNYVRVPQIVVLGTGWTLLVEVSFYALVLATLRLRRYAPAVASWVTLGATWAVVVSAKDLGPGWFLFAATVSYVPLLVLGQAIWLRWSGKTGWLSFLAITVVAWAVYINGLERLQPQFLVPSPQAYGPSMAIAYGLFVAALFAGDRLRPSAIVGYVATRSYSVYLLHPTIGLLALDALARHVPYSLALLGAVLATGVSSELSYRFVEVPSQRAARRLTRRHQRRADRPGAAARRPERMLPP